MRDGWSPEEAFELREPKHIKAFVIFGGKKFNSLAHLADAYSINRRTFYQRLENGWTREQALELDTSLLKPGVSFIYKGSRYRYDTVTEALEAWGVKHGTYYARLKSGYTLKQALGIEAIT